MIGRKVRLIRRSQRKSLEVVAGLAGMSRSELSRIELGQRALDRRSKIVALANALQVAPSELINVDVPAPGIGEGEAVKAVRRALVAVSRHRPGGQVLGIKELRSRVRAVLDADRQCRWVGVDAALPGLIRDLHTSIRAGRDVAELLDLAVMLHVNGTGAWLGGIGAGAELRSLNMLVARQAAEHRDDPTMLGLAVWGDGLVMLSAGDVELARAELDAVAVPTNTPESMQMAGELALCQSYVRGRGRPAPSGRGGGHGPRQRVGRTHRGGRCLRVVVRPHQRGHLAVARCCGGWGLRARRRRCGRPEPAGAPQPGASGRVLEQLRSGAGPSAGTAG
ncbi:MAG: helix-turn-helix transcriptional regulator [Pseudonocardiales bacterium]|nr:helix-turn-helix transcriptional regulator [Pseudonocardiales bacterium]